MDVSVADRRPGSDHSANFEDDLSVRHWNPTNVHTKDFWNTSKDAPQILRRRKLAR